jgi:1-deoxy-D-xylulose-5-phosphate reductoisomerase
MFNKALELIETKEFFDFKPEQIETVVHPESMIHALVGFNDGGFMAHVGPADMRHAIGFALHHPTRKKLPVERLDLVKLGQFTFRDPCETRWPALRLAREVMQAGGLMGAVFNASKEIALDAFIAEQIGFTDMAAVVEQVLTRLSSHSGHNPDAISLDMVLEADHLARHEAAQVIADLS